MDIGLGDEDRLKVREETIEGWVEAGGGGGGKKWRWYRVWGEREGVGEGWYQPSEQGHMLAKIRKKNRRKQMRNQQS